MTNHIIAPSLGEGVSEAVLARWLKAPGESVVAGEALLVLETDKASVEVVAEVDGVLGSAVAHSGDVVAVGALLGRIDQPGGPG